MACVSGVWHVRHAPSAISRLRGVIWMACGKRPVVNANECQKPLSALVLYLPMTSCGAWQSLQTATERRPGRW
jgi:hypothetical protein